jgi:hypothetical protein
MTPEIKVPFSVLGLRTMASTIAKDGLEPIILIPRQVGTHIHDDACELLADTSDHEK